MNWWTRKQKAGSGSNQYQANNIAIDNSGLKYSEVRDLCIDIVSAELEKYTATARETLDQRMEEFFENYFRVQAERAPENMASLERPSMQRAYRTAQVEFGCSGDADLGELLVDLLTAMAATDEGSMLSATLQTALEVAPKVGQPELAALTAVLIFKMTVLNQVADVESFYKLMRTDIPTISAKLSTQTNTYRHIFGLGLGLLTIASQPLGQVIVERYPGLFTHGFTADETFAELMQERPEFFLAALRDSTKLQVAATTEQVLEYKIGAYQVSGEQQESIKSLFKNGVMTPDEARADFEREVPGSESLFKLWTDTDLGSIELTTVGIVLGQANWDRNSSQALSVDIYLPSGR